MAINLDGPLNVQENPSFLSLPHNNSVNLAFIINSIVERIMKVMPPLPEILSSEYTFKDLTESKRAEKESSMFFFEVESKDGLVLAVSSDESMWALISSLPLGVEIPSDLDVQIGWTYTVEDGFVSN